jgi:hypothetical protein
LKDCIMNILSHLLLNLYLSSSPSQHTHTHTHTHTQTHAHTHACTNTRVHSISSRNKDIFLQYCYHAPYHVKKSQSSLKCSPFLFFSLRFSFLFCPSSCPFVLSLLIFNYFLTFWFTLFHDQIVCFGPQI